MQDAIRTYENVLGITSPWYIKDLLSPDLGTIEFRVTYDRSKIKFICPKCGYEHVNLYDHREKTWNHVKNGTLNQIVSCAVPRVRCPNCGGIHQMPVPWSKPYAQTTIQVDKQIIDFASELSLKSTEKHTGVSSTKVFNRIKYYTDEALIRQDLSDLEVIGVDETAAKRGHKYVTNFVDMKKGTVVFSVQGKDKNTISAFKSYLIEHNGKPENIKAFSSDMSPAFVSGITECFPNAQIVLDHFHIMFAANKALNDVLIADRKCNNKLKSTKYLWLTNPNNLSKESRERLETLLEMETEVGVAYQFRNELQKLWDCPDYETAKKYLKDWIQRAIRTEIKPIVKLAKLVQKHSEGILNYFNHRISNGLLEGINSVIQQIKRVARGYGNIEHFITMIYFRKAGLDIRVDI